MGGGGIYVNSTCGKLTIINAEITGNYAAGLGGGIATCAHGKIAEANIDGCAIYNNYVLKDYNEETKKTTDRKKPAHHPSTWIDASDTWADENYKAFWTAATDVLSAGNKSKGDTWDHPGGTIISDKMLGGGTHGWTGYTIPATGGKLEAVTPANNGVLYSGYAMGLKAANSPKKSIAAPKVLIKGNASATDGGGIGCNGILLLSATTPPIDVNVLDNELSVNVNKELKGADYKDHSFTFELLKDDLETVIATASTNKTEKATLSCASAIDPNGEGFKNNKEYTFYLREKNEGGNFSYDESVYKITAKVVYQEGKDTTEKVHVNHENNEVQEVTFKHYKVQVTNKEKGVVENGAWKATKDGDGTVKFTNYYGGKLVIQKAFSNDDAAKVDKDGKSFTVNVKITKSGQPDRNEIVTLESPTWKAEIGNILAGSHYEVTETVDTDSNYALSSINPSSGEISAGDNITVIVTNTRDTGSLKLVKLLAGDGTAADVDTEWNFLVTLTYSDGSPLSGTFGGYEFKNGQCTIGVKAGEDNAKTITGIPTGTTYTVKETTEKSGYAVGVVYSDDESKKISAKGETDTVTITNTRYVGNIAVAKKIAGAGASDKDVFNFTIAFNGAVDCKATFYRNDGTQKTVNVTGASYDFTLKGNEIVAFDGLPNGTQYKVTETENKTNGYTGEVTSQQESGIARPKKGRAALPSNDITVEGATDEKKDLWTTVFTNTREAGSLTVNKTMGGAGAKDEKVTFEIKLDLSGVNKDVWENEEEILNWIKAEGNIVIPEGATSKWTDALTLKVEKDIKADGGSTQIAELKMLPIGTTYTVTETTEKLTENGYEVLYTLGGDDWKTITEKDGEFAAEEGSIDKDAESDSLTFKDFRGAADLTIGKTVVGYEDTLENKREWTFTVTLTDGNGKNISGVIPVEYNSGTEYMD